MNKYKYPKTSIIMAILLFCFLILFLFVDYWLIKNYYIAGIVNFLIAYTIFVRFEYALNGCSDVWLGMKEDLKWFWFGGLKHRTQFIKDDFKNNKNLTLAGTFKVWQSSDLPFTEKKYEECAKSVLGTGFYFWTSKFIVPLLFILFMTNKYYNLF